MLKYEPAERRQQQQAEVLDITNEGVIHNTTNKRYALIRVGACEINSLNFVVTFKEFQWD